MNGVVEPGGREDEAVDTVVVELRRLTRAADRFRQAVHAGTGLSGSELTALAALVDHGPLRAVDVVAATGLTPGSVTALLDRLESRDLIRRGRPRADKRVLSLEATAEGRALLTTVTEPVRAAVIHLIDATAGLGADTLLRVLSGLADGLERIDRPAFSPPDAGSGTSPAYLPPSR
jgi:DNA-binding MarR family transcriptional regulator